MVTVKSTCIMSQLAFWVYTMCQELRVQSKCLAGRDFYFKLKTWTWHALMFRPAFHVFQFCYHQEHKTQNSENQTWCKPYKRSLGRDGSGYATQSSAGSDNKSNLDDDNSIDETDNLESQNSRIEYKVAMKQEPAMSMVRKKATKQKSCKSKLFVALTGC